jgi:Phosphopantothenoylcysteine synthetase/decarboxylase
VSSDIKCSLGNTLYDKNIVHCLTGSVSVYKAIDISRYLVRYGANVIPVMSEDAIHLISPDLMEYATGNKVITKITGEVEHVKVFERYRVDMILIAPSTANTISKIANGISDTNVTLIASIALGKGIPLLIAPAMHEPMYRNPILIENIKS